MHHSHSLKNRISAWLVALCMAVVLLPSGVFAATGSITITAPPDVTFPAGFQVDAYEVMKLVNPDQNNPQAKIYEVTDGFKPFFNIDAIKAVFGTVSGKPLYLTYGGDSTPASERKISVTATEPASTVPRITITNSAALDTQYPVSDLLDRINKSSKEVLAMYYWLEDYIKNTGTISPQATETVQQNTTNSIQLTGLEEGGYALVFSNAGDDLVINQGILVPTGETMALKGQTITLDKQVSTSADQDFGNSATAEIGQTLYYKVESKLPVPSADQSFVSFTMTDTMENQLVDASSFGLKLGTSQQLTATVVNQTVQFKDSQTLIATLTVNTDKKGFSLVFDQAVLQQTVYQGLDVLLTYQAELTKDAVAVNDNRIVLNYSHGPNEISQEAVTQAYTYGLTVEKKFTTDAGVVQSPGSAVVNGVTFKLYRGHISGTPAASNQPIPVSNVTATAAGQYVLDDTKTTTELKLDANAALSVKGLGEGQYTLVETQAPDGYIRTSNIHITVAANGTTKYQLDTTNTKATVDGIGTPAGFAVGITQAANADSTTLSTVNLTVNNRKGFELPKTGGEGTWAFTIGGIALIALAGAMIRHSKKQ